MRYAVVQESGDSTSMKRFSRWHETKELAIEEAKRLSQKEGHEFSVLVEIGIARPTMPPVEFVEVKGDQW